MRTSRIPGATLLVRETLWPEPVAYFMAELTKKQADRGLSAAGMSGCCNLCHSDRRRTIRTKSGGIVMKQSSQFPGHDCHANPSLRPRRWKDGYTPKIEFCL